MQIEIITLLSKYSVDCVATAISVFFILYIIKKEIFAAGKTQSVATVLPVVCRLLRFGGHGQTAI